MASMSTISLPVFGRAEHCPKISDQVLRRRQAEAVARAGDAGLDVLVVYGDREHSAHLEFLTGFEPRFEEALFLLDRQGTGLLLVGNECMGYLPEADLGLSIELFQDFSLMGQPRDKSRPLYAILADFGIGRGSRVGCVGWKCYQSRLVAKPPAEEVGQPVLDAAPWSMDLPAYIVDALRELTGSDSHVTNATGIFVNPDDGLCVINEPEQIAQFEYAAAISSEGVLRVMRAIQPGAAENELECLLDSRGLPLSCHRMISFGDKARRGLSSPSARRALLGGPYTLALGVTGSLTCRAGCVARGPEDLSDELKDFYPRVAANYFSVVAGWYAVRVGVAAGNVFREVDSRRDAHLFDFAVNPGHYIHLNEWVHSPFAPGSATLLKSGMALQMDIIPVSRGPFCCVNAEDGIVLADAALRDRLAQSFPDCWERMCARRVFMERDLGIRLDASVLPLSNMPAWLPPYVLAMEQALVV